MNRVPSAEIPRGQLHHNLRLEQIPRHTLVRQHDPTVDIQLILDRHVLAKHGVILDADPLPDGGIPSHDCQRDPRVRLDLHARQQGALGEPDAVVDDAARADDDVGADAALGPDAGGLVDEDVADEFGARGEQLGLALPEGGEVEALAREVVLGLADVGPVAFEFLAEELAAVADLGEDFFFDGGGLHGDALEDARGEEVHARVDAVADKLLRLLHEARDLALLVVDHDAELGGVLDLGHENRGLCVPRAVKREHLLERIIACDVGIQHEERLAVVEVILGELNRARGAHGLGLAAGGDLDAEPLLLALQKLFHDLRLVIHGEHDLLHAHRGERLDLVHDDRLIAKLDERLREGEGERPEAGAVAADEN
eukprot:CAMPEP_0174913216 /NCGR_PEP_ID=MMETSP0167-20121228/80192_1 /TAXON_ID=38298 /ORGANISM="Rhodella maculata, Strain CCMP736" /LENGTH=368 /DNA_ID=CAMNT_0016157927 /DNA_START=415 /DNA_END=1521 /DNA_ORIENTATION=-